MARTWKYTHNQRQHLINLYHDTITGVRSAMLNYEEIFVLLSDYEMERDFRGDATALQFCSGSNKNAEYVIVWFIGDQVEGVSQYYKEIPRDERCGWFFGEVDWAQAPTAVKTELYIE